jgi:protein-S-isoprenylcysteine O-methyltransferase Ste14
MSRLLALLYGTLVYVLFLGTFLYAIGFVGNFGFMPKTIDSGAVGPWPMAVLINAGLLGLFAIQHSVMARPGFKRWWTRIVPKSVERSTYVLFASLALLLMYWQWRPITAPIWTLTDSAAVTAVNVVFGLGFAIVLISTFLISHFELFGMHQVVARFMNRAMPEAKFHTPGFYRYVRHPIYLGFILAFWATPTMTAGHLLFAIATTGYILIGIWFEERDLIEQFGERYRVYRQQVGMLVPRLRKSRSATIENV